MFAPIVSRPQTKAVEAATDRLAPRHSTFVGQPFGHDSVAQLRFLQRTIGNQAMLRLARQVSNPPGNRSDGDHPHKSYPATERESRSVGQVFTLNSASPMLARAPEDSAKGLEQVRAELEGDMLVARDIILEEFWYPNERPSGGAPHSSSAMQLVRWLRKVVRNQRGPNVQKAQALIERISQAQAKIPRISKSPSKKYTAPDESFHDDPPGGTGPGKSPRGKGPSGPKATAQTGVESGSEGKTGGTPASAADVEFFAPNRGSILSTDGSVESGDSASGGFSTPSRGSVTTKGGAVRFGDSASGEIRTPLDIHPGMAAGAEAGAAALDALGFVGALKFGHDYQKEMEYINSLKSGEYFEEFWLEIRAFPQGAQIIIEDMPAIVDKRNGTKLISKDGSVMRAISSKKGGLGMEITLPDKSIHEVDKNGIRTIGIA